MSGKKTYTVTIICDDTGLGRSFTVSTAFSDPSPTLVMAFGIVVKQMLEQIRTTES